MFGIKEKPEFHYVYGGDDTDGWVEINEAQFGDFIDNSAVDVGIEPPVGYSGNALVSFFIENDEVNVEITLALDYAFVLSTAQADTIATLLSEASIVGKTILEVK